MKKLIKNFLVVFFLMICSIFAEVKIPHEIITENPSREVKIVESKKMKEKAEMNITVKKLTPLEINGGITSSNGKYVIDTGKYDVKELNKDNFLVVKDLNELKKGFDINGNLIRENIQSQINFEVESMENKIFLNIENIEDVYVAVIYKTKIVKIFYCNPITSINTIDVKLDMTNARVKNENNFLISKNKLELEKNTEGISIENKIPSTQLLRTRRNIEEEKTIDSMKITIGEKSIFVNGLTYTENPNYDIQLENNGKNLTLIKKSNNSLNENIIVESYSNNLQIGELRLAILNDKITTELGEITYRIDGRLRGVEGQISTGAGRYIMVSPNVLNDFKWIARKDSKTSVDGIDEAFLQKTSNGSNYEFPALMECDRRNYDSSKNTEIITSIEVVGQTAEKTVDTLTEYTTPNGNIALKKDASTVEELINSIRMGINTSDKENNQTIKLVINNIYTLDITREEKGQPKDIYDMGPCTVTIYSYEDKVRIREETGVNSMTLNGAYVQNTGQGKYIWPKVTGNIESYKGKLVANNLEIWRRQSGQYPGNPERTDKESKSISLGSGVTIQSKYDGNIFKVETDGTLDVELKANLYDPVAIGHYYLSYSINLMYVKNGYNIILARLGRSFLPNEEDMSTMEGLRVKHYLKGISEMSSKAVLTIDSRLKKIVKNGQLVVSDGSIVDINNFANNPQENYKYLMKKRGTSPFENVGDNIFLDIFYFSAAKSENLDTPISEMQKEAQKDIKIEQSYIMPYFIPIQLIKVSDYYLLTKGAFGQIRIKDILKDITINLYAETKDIMLYLLSNESAAVVKYGWEDFPENREHNTTGTLDLSALKKSENVQFGRGNTSISGLVLKGEIYDLRSIDNNVANIATKVKIEKLASDGSLLESKESSDQTSEVAFDYNTFRMDSNGNLSVTKNEFNGDAVKYRITPYYYNVPLGSLTLDITNGKESTFGIYGDDTFDFGDMVPGRDSVLSGVVNIMNSGDERIIKVEVDKTGEMTKVGGSTPVPLEIAAANEILPKKDKNNVVIKSHMVVKAKPPKNAESGEYKGQFQVIITVDR